MNEFHGFGISAQPEVKTSESGTKYATFGLGIKEKPSSKNFTFFKVVCFDEQADFVEKYLLKKGTNKIFVHGRLKKDEVDESFYIIAQRIHFLPNFSG